MVVLSFNLWLTLWGPLECACIQFMYVPLKWIKPDWNGCTFFYSVVAVLKASLQNILKFGEDFRRFGSAFKSLSEPEQHVGTHDERLSLEYKKINWIPTSIIFDKHDCFPHILWSIISRAQMWFYQC